MEKTLGKGKKIQGKRIQFFKCEKCALWRDSLLIQWDTKIHACSLSILPKGGVQDEDEMGVTKAGEAEVPFESKGKFDPTGKFYGR